jgi:hypothetical protein
MEIEAVQQSDGLEIGVLTFLGQVAEPLDNIPLKKQRAKFKTIF